MRTGYILTPREDQGAQMRTIFSKIGNAFAIALRSPTGSSASDAESDATRRRRPSCSSFTPFAVAATRDTRLSVGSDARSTSPADSNFSTKRVIVGGRTCSAAARAPSVIGPPKTITDNADSCGAGSPAASSSRRRRRNRWMAAEWRRSARSLSAVAPGLTRRLDGVAADTLVFSSAKYYRVLLS